MSNYPDPCNTCVLDDCDFRSARCKFRKTFNAAQRLRRSGKEVPPDLQKWSSEYHRQWQIEHRADVSEGLR